MMKNHIKYLILLMTGVLLMTSCTEELVADKGEFDDPTCYGIYFPSQTGTGDVQISPDDPTVFRFTVKRSNTRGDLYVPVTVKSSHEGVFTTSEVYFEEDSPASEVEVYFPTAKMGITYECTLLIEGDEYVSKYSKNASFLDFNVTVVKWNKLIGADGSTKGLWRDGVLCDYFSLNANALEQSIEIYERDDKPGYYRLHDVYGYNYVSNLFQADASSVCVEKTYTYIDATDPDKVWIPTFRLGLVLSSEYGQTSMGSYVVENDDFDPSISSVYGKMENGVITFPSGAIHLNLSMMGWYPANNKGTHRIILPGYRAIDDAINMEAGVSDNGKLPVKISFGRDIDTLKVVAYPGSLNGSQIAEQVEKIKNGKVKKDDIIELLKEKTLEYTFASTGEYTLVAVGFDADGMMVNSSSVSFGYLKAGDTKDVELTFGLICSDKYAPEGKTSENSLEVYINGKGLTKVHVALYEKEQFEKNEEIYLKNLELSKMTDESLDLINGEGLSLVQSGLVPGTEYVLLVKAGNGYAEKTDFVTESTGGKWDYRLAYYTFEDSNEDYNVTIDDFCGEWNFYAIEGSDNSRYCHGPVTITDTGKKDSYYNRPILNAKGFFPFIREAYEVKDDSMQFTYYEGCIWNHELAFDHFVYEGTYVYADMMLFASDGGAYGGVNGVLGTFVTKRDADGNVRPDAKPCIAFMDSGLAEQQGLDVTFNGFALLGYEDSSHSMFMGLLDLVESMVLIRPEEDPDPVYPPYDEEEDEEEVKAAMMAKTNLHMLNTMLKAPRFNYVEYGDGYIMSLIDRLRQTKSVKNYFDMGTAMRVEERTVQAVKCQVTE